MLEILRSSRLSTNTWSKTTITLLDYLFDINEQRYNIPQPRKPLDRELSCKATNRRGWLRWCCGPEAGAFPADVDSDASRATRWARTSRAALAVMICSPSRVWERIRNFWTWTASRIWAVLSTISPGVSWDTTGAVWSTISRSWYIARVFSVPQ